MTKVQGILDRAALKFRTIHESDSDDATRSTPSDAAPVIESGSPVVFDPYVIERAKRQTAKKGALFLYIYEV